LWKETIHNLTKRFQAQYGQENLICGISAPGLTDTGNAAITHMPGRMKGLEGLMWSEYLQIPAFVVNDAQAACMAESLIGVAKGSHHVVMLTLGTGVGGAVLIDGKLYTGLLGRAGHFGHITLDYTGESSATEMVGSLETAIGDYTVGKRTRGLYNSTAELVEAYKRGEAKATYWWLESINKLAVGISSIINAFSPEVVVIGGGVTGAGDSLFGPLNDFMALYEWRPTKESTRIVKAQLGEYAGAIGAALFANMKLKEAIK
jgi:glucokinase